MHFSNPAQLSREQAFIRSHLPKDLSEPRLPIDVERKAWRDLQRTLGDDVLQAPCSRLYLGNEFCPHLSWTSDELLNASRIAAQNRYAVTLVLGIVVDSELDRVAGAVKAVRDEVGSLEVVANDWGMLARLRDLQVTPVAGRFLFRMKRLPRVSRKSRPVISVDLSPRAAEKRIIGSQLAEFAVFPWDAPWMQEFAQTAGLGRIDAEMVPQGISFAEDSALSVSLHLPFTYVTGGGPCPVMELHDDNGKLSCRRHCRSTYITPRFPTKTWEMSQVGNTLFSRMTSLVAHYVGMDRFDRFILEASLPM